MCAALAVSGWALALVLGVLVVVLRGRLELAARAEHELRGPLAVIALAAESLRRDPRTARHARALELELDRLRVGLADLREARHGRVAPVRLAAVDAAETVRTAAAARGLSFDWRGRGAVVRTDRGRLAQALGNLLANAEEHGRGTVRLQGRQDGGRVLLEVRNGGAPAARRSRRPRDRGRGLAIAASAAESVGGELSVERAGDDTVARLELPAEEPPTAA